MKKKASSPSGKIYFFGSSGEFKAHGKVFLAQIKKSISTGQYLQGKEVAELENVVASLTGRKFGVAVNSSPRIGFRPLIALAPALAR